MGVARGLVGVATYILFRRTVRKSLGNGLIDPIVATLMNICCVEVCGRLYITTYDIYTVW